MLKRLAEFFEDECGRFSMSRLLAFLLVMAFIFFAGVMVFKDKGLPDIPMGWAGLIAALYFTNKAANVFDVFGKPKEGSKP